MYTISTGVPDPLLTSIPPAPLQGNQCHAVQITCRTYELNSLRWYYEEREIAFFVHDPGSQFPFTIHNENGVKIQATDAVAESADSDPFNGTSILTTTTLALSRLNASSIRCGTRSTRSDPIDLTLLNIQREFTDFYSRSQYKLPIPLLWNWHSMVNHFKKD